MSSAVQSTSIIKTSIFIDQLCGGEGKHLQLSGVDGTREICSYADFMAGAPLCMDVSGKSPEAGTGQHFSSVHKHSGL